jgi:hypothetical protein
MHQGTVVHVGPKCQDDVGIAGLGELVALLGKPSNVISEGPTLLLSATLQIPRVARLYVCALKVVGEDLCHTQKIQIEENPKSFINHKLNQRSAVFMPPCIYFCTSMLL